MTAALRAPQRHCQFKRAYVGRAAAEFARQAISAMFDDVTLRAYRCDRCLGWHIGHSSPPRVAFAWRRILEQRAEAAR